jgi:hypothetical protein
MILNAPIEKFMASDGPTTSSWCWQSALEDALKKLHESNSGSSPSHPLQHGTTSLQPWNAMMMTVLTL